MLYIACQGRLSSCYITRLADPSFVTRTAMFSQRGMASRPLLVRAPITAAVYTLRDGLAIL